MFDSKQKEDREEPLPCPFCGKQPDVHERNSGNAHFWCRIFCSCSVNPETELGHSGNSAHDAYRQSLNMWNLRKGVK